MGQHPQYWVPEIVGQEINDMAQHPQYWVPEIVRQEINGEAQHRQYRLPEIVKKRHGTTSTVLATRDSEAGNK